MDYFRAFESATTAANDAVAVLLQTRYDFLLTPTLGLLPMPIDNVPPFLGDVWARYVQFVLPVSFARVPAISIPAGLHDGLPVGVQLVGRFAQEYELLDFAEVHAIHGLAGGSSRHRPLVAVELPVGKQEQVRVEQASVDPLQRQFSPAAFTNDLQYGCGVSHLAYLLSS